MPEGRFVQAMGVAVRQAGAVARSLQGKVLDEGKVSDVEMPNDDDDLRRKRAAKTVVDEIVQEVLILAASQQLDTLSTLLDAEEETSSTCLFSSTPSETALVLDPIDGTLEYIEGLSLYSVCVGLVTGHRLKAALVYFPARDHLYVLDENGRGFFAASAYSKGLAVAKPLTVTKTPSKLVYYNGRVPKKAQTRLQLAGFEIIDDTVDNKMAPDCILACASGEAYAYIAHTRQLRDILLGGVLAGCDGGFASDWSGQPLLWPSGGRVERALFTAGPPRPDLIECLRPFA